MRFQLFSEQIDPVGIAQALQATGTVPVRRRKLPAEYVVWIAVGLGLLRDRSIQEVVRHLDLVSPDAKPPQGRGSAAGSAVLQARDRLGAEPLAGLVAGRCTETPFPRVSTSRQDQKDQDGQLSVEARHLCQAPS